MIEAVENHMPEVIIIDEIGTEAEALAARTIAQRGVQLVATAHGEAAAQHVARLAGSLRALTRALRRRLASHTAAAAPRVRRLSHTARLSFPAGLQATSWRT